jgi:NhaA family Na+:H+ antiporter
LSPARLPVSPLRRVKTSSILRGFCAATRPCATDIAFSYLVARVILGPRHPGIPFLLLLAIADDALGLLILAAFYPTGPVRPLQFAMLLAAAMLIASWLKRRGTRTFWPYVAGAGIVSWLALYRGGLHPALALVPVIPFIPHATRDAGLFVDAFDAADPLTEFERWRKLPVQVILFFFGLVNAGVPMSAVGTGTWIVFT